MINALSVDLEDWYHICGVDLYADTDKWSEYESRIIRNTDKILQLLDRFKVRATFFVLGYIASKEPELIGELVRRGHEVATHGYYHRRVFEMTPNQFEEDLNMSIEVISSITGEKVIGFRAPEWSIRPDTLWALNILRKAGILYDSSMVSLTRMGSRSFPLTIKEFDTEYGVIIEYPLSTVRLFRENIPYSGGLPLRLVPYFYIAQNIRSANLRGQPVMTYIHPWEFDTHRPLIDLPFSRRFMHYCNIEATPRKIEHMLKHFSFAPINEVLGIS